MRKGQLKISSRKIHEVFYLFKIVYQQLQKEHSVYFLDLTSEIYIYILYWIGLHV